MDKEHSQLYGLLPPLGGYPLQLEGGGSDQLVQFHREADVIWQIDFKRKQSHKLLVKLYDITIKSKLFLHSDPRLYLCNPLLQQGQLILQPQLLVFDDADEFDKLVVFLFLLTDMFFAE